MALSLLVLPPIRIGETEGFRDLWAKPHACVFWDDLQLNNGSYVYTWHNSAQHYYVVDGTM
jgi:hypothetical protein